MAQPNDQITALLGLISEQMTYARHHETLRERSTQIVLVIAGILLAVARLPGVQDVATVPLGIALMVIGVFGMLISLKHYEKHQEHYDQAQKLIPVVHQIAKTKSAKHAAKRARDDVRYKFRWLKYIRLHQLWVIINIMVIVAGVYLLFDNTPPPK